MEVPRKTTLTPAIIFSTEHLFIDLALQRAQGGRYLLTKEGMDIVQYRLAAVSIVFRTVSVWNVSL